MRCILHIDMDAFYAAVEQRDQPQLRGKPLVVGGTGNRGVVAAASYEARRFGIRSAMSMAEARRRCPVLKTRRPRMAHYRKVSRQIFTVFREFTPSVESLSLDEAFLDVTASLGLFASGEAIGRRIKARILATTALTASVGVAGNKLVAKIASELDKPDGLVVVDRNETRATLDPLPAAVLPGIGRRTLARLECTGIRTLGDIRRADERTLRRLFGRDARKLRERAAGIDDRPVLPERNEQSISAEETFDTDLTDPGAMLARVLDLSERTAMRLRRAHLAAGTIRLKVRRADFTTCTRQSALGTPSNDTARLYAAARRLLAEWRAGHPETPVRLLGVGASRLIRPSQGDLFADLCQDRGIIRQQAVDAAIDSIRARFPDTSIGRARRLRRN